MRTARHHGLASQYPEPDARNCGLVYNDKGQAALISGAPPLWAIRPPTRDASDRVEH